MEISHLVEGLTPKERERRIETIVCELTGMTSEEYAAQKFEKGIEYLEKYLFNEADVADITKQSMFWAWWRNRWTMREEALLKMFDEATLRRCGKEALREVHNQCLSKMRMAGIIKN